MINYSAYFDCLSIGNRLDDFLGDFIISEVYLFAYLSCLLSLYKENPVSAWGYIFGITKSGYPYSVDLDKSIGLLISNGYFKLTEHIMQITEEGKEEYKILRTISLNLEREPFLDGACSTLLTLPVGIVRGAISQGPEIRSALSLSQSNLLLLDPGLNILYDQFSALSSAIGLDIEDLVVPAIVWIKYLSYIQEHQYQEKIS